MVCLPCNPCPRPPCPCRPICIPRPCHPPCRIPAPPITGPRLNGPCISAPPVMGPCHPPCLPQRPPFIPVPLRAAPPVLPINQPVVVDHPLKGPAPIYIDQCHDVIPECRDFAKRGMCNHPSPFHSIKQIRKICAFSCGICNDYDENAALLRRQTHSRINIRPAMRAKLNRALAQIIRNRDLEGHSTLEPQQNKAGKRKNKLGRRKVMI
ncbi:hypothetical protein OS493_013862 [Desmophyllum pertusum]|uniref:ShKT domain-containing protein n=1 Tax=Desmophyllum pertusum TaxID=174260 RepID=A0A9X0D3E2_9CNID|nr:hypothetical protein OS493_013862 [Desmophyllum pertusum]